jgi:hypothetical protein
MADDMPFALALIAAEESQREQQQARASQPTEMAAPPEYVPEERDTDDTTYIINAAGFTESQRFVPTGTNTQQRLPISGPGRLDSLLISASSPQFSVYVEDGTREIYHDSFGSFEDYSGELPYVSAYTRDSNSILNITDRAFSDELFVVIRPTGGAVTFNRVRVEATAPPQQDTSGQKP